MATTRIELPDQLEAYIQYKIRAGLYSNGAEVIRDALRHMMESDEDVGKAIRLRDAVGLGFDQLAQGYGVAYQPGMIQQMQESAHARAKQGDKPKADVVG